MAKPKKSAQNRIPPKPKPLTSSERATLGRILKKARAVRSYNAAIAKRDKSKK